MPDVRADPLEKRGGANRIARGVSVGKVCDRVDLSEHRGAARQIVSSDDGDDRFRRGSSGYDSR
jgi:hypothetical protein